MPAATMMAAPPMYRIVVPMPPVEGRMEPDLFWMVVETVPVSLSERNSALPVEALSVEPLMATSSYVPSFAVLMIENVMGDIAL